MARNSKSMRDFLLGNPDEIINDNDIFAYETENDIYYQDMGNNAYKVKMK